MRHYLRFGVALLFSAVAMVNFRLLSLTSAAVVESFMLYQVVPDVVSVAPPELLFVQFASGAVVAEGNVISPSQVQEAPTVAWEAAPGAFYTLAMLDLDAPSRTEPINRSILHWLVGNIFGCDVAGGELLARYWPSNPWQYSGLHRYVFLLYKQPGRIEFDEPGLLDPSSPELIKFSIANFAEKYNLGDSIAGNFFQAAWEGCPCYR